MSGFCAVVYRVFCMFCASRLRSVSQIILAGEGSIKNVVLTNREADKRNTEAKIESALVEERPA